eukprot:6805704-Ditylum_brightwellii.AAC.1
MSMMMTDSNPSILTAATALASLVDQVPIGMENVGSNSIAIAHVPTKKKAPKKQKPLTFPQK